MSQRGSLGSLSVRCHYTCMYAQERVLDDEALAILARGVRLELPPERIAALGPAVRGTYALIDTLDALALEDVPPATAFDARRR